MNASWNTIAQYNAVTWSIQIPLVIAAVAVLYLLIRRPSRSNTIIAKSYLILLHVWIAVAYYVIYCVEHGCSILLNIYWGILALARIRDLLKDDAQFVLRDKFKPLGIFALLLPPIYLLASITRGLSFPYIITLVMSYTVAIYTIGLLLLFTSRVNIPIVLLLLNRTMAGVTKTWFFGIPEDSILVLMAVPTPYIFFRECFVLDLRQDSKPQTEYINILLILIRIGVCIALCCTLFA